MVRINNPRRRQIAALLTAVSALAVSACSDPSTETDGTTDTGESMVTESWGNEPVDSVVALVPEEFKNQPIQNAIYNDFPPQEFLDGDQLVGIQPDIALALSEVMGVEIENVPVGSFDSLIPGTSAGRYDMSSADFGVTAERLSEVDFVTEFRIGTGFAVNEGSDISIGELTDLCGLAVGVQTGSYYIDQLQAAGEECTAGGMDPVDVKTYPDEGARTLALTNGRIDATATNEDVLGYQIAGGLGLVLQDFVYEPIEQAIVIPKGSDLGPAVQAAMQELVENGTYAKILEKWGVEYLAYASPGEVLYLTDPSEAP